MEVKLEKRYPLDVDAASAWQVLRDVKATAECMPGASITEQVDATHFKGAVKVKVGPANAAFAGDIEVLALDESAMKLQLLGKGADRGGSSASMDLTATVEPGKTPQSSVLVGNAAVIVNGKFAQFGGRLMVQVSDMLLAQFADNFRLAAAAVPVAVAVAPVVAASLAPAGASNASQAAPEAVAHAAAAAVAPMAPFGAPVALAASAVPVSAATLPTSRTPARTHEINGLAIAWHLVKSWFAGLFGKHPA